MIGTLCLVPSGLMGIAMFLSSEEYSEGKKKKDYHVLVCGFLNIKGEVIKKKKKQSSGKWCQF